MLREKKYRKVSFPCPFLCFYSWIPYLFIYLQPEKGTSFGRILHYKEYPSGREFSLATQAQGIHNRLRAVPFFSWGRSREQNTRARAKLTCRTETQTRSASGKTIRFLSQFASLSARPFSRWQTFGRFRVYISRVVASLEMPIFAQTDDG